LPYPKGVVVDDDLARLTLYVDVRGWDVWDRQEPWGENANSYYRMAGQALGTYREHSADRWLTSAWEYMHTGAAFRRALWLLRRGSSVGRVMDWLMAADADGHRDAERLYLAYERCEDRRIRGSDAKAVLLASVATAPEDPAFAAEVAVRLAQTLF
jgi:hypothetical protein